MKRARIILFSVFIGSFLFSCSPVRKLGDNAVLLNKNIIKVDKQNLKEGITPIIKQKPNRKILGVFRFNLGMYNLFNRGDSTKFKEWVKRTIGEEPVLLDTSLTAKSNRQIKQYMQKTGYFNAEVNDSIIFISKHQANVVYYITSNQPYIIQNTFYSIKDSVIESLINSDRKNTLLNAGNNYDEYVFQKERERITTLLKNNGYYFFNQQYITIKIDSSLQSNQVNVYLLISNPDENNTDSITFLKNKQHKQYTFNKIYIRTDFDPLTITEKTITDTINFNDYLFLSGSKHLNYRPPALADHIFFKSGDLYSVSNHENTYRAMSDLGNFRFINIKLETDNEAISKNENKLNCYLNLTPLLRQSYKIELEGTHNGGNLGAAGNFIYTNKNLFKGAEILDLKLKAAVEDLRNSTVVEENKFLLFNTYEFGPEASLNIPRVIPLLRPKNKSVISSTNFNISYNLQQRPEFFRRIADFSAGIIYKFSNSVRLEAYPAQVNFVNVKLDPIFKAKLDEIGDPGLTSSYADHLITDGRTSLIITTQELNKLKNFIFFRLNLEAAGNLLRATTNFKNFFKDTTYTFFGNRYAQYIKPDFDLRFYHILDQNNTLVYRIVMGIGIPYLNSQSLPFEKSFYAGGANDLRAFTARSIGPGSYRQDEIIQQTGEIKINGNLEYRFDIFRILQGAMFIDAGNVWLTHDDAIRPGGVFEWNKFYNEFAIGGGIGFRFNFTFFIFRIDAGYKFRDPSLPENERWVYDNLHLFKGVTGNFGIGYPF